MQRILVVIGTRPEAIKMAPVILALRARQSENRRLIVRVCATAQHREMLDQTLAVFGIRPDHDLDLMRHGQDLSEVTSRVLFGLREVLRKERPELVLVHGDTTTAFAASLAAFYERLPVGHVEAGLRTGDNDSPWPEEANRRLIAVLASQHFAPTDRAAENLISEGVAPDRVVTTGNTGIDALLHAVERLADFERQGRLPSICSQLQPDRRLLLVTGHRRENFGDGLLNLCRALRALASREDLQIAYPVHPNPSVRDPVQRALGGHDQILLTGHLDYLSFVYLMQRSDLILTDSGGVQEEAPSLSKPVLVTRTNTERPEGIEAGTAKLVGASFEAIMQAVTHLLDDPDAHKRMASPSNPYGDGQAASRIVEAVLAT